MSDLDFTARGLAAKGIRNRKGLNVLLCGAIGDGIHDDTQALQDAIYKAFYEGYEGIYLPIGYRFRTLLSLLLPSQERPNTAATMGRGFKIEGDGMYDSGIIYEGSGYAIYSDKDMAESVVFKDFYINHRNGGGIHLPQGAHQTFERFFSSAVGEDCYGVYINGQMINGDQSGGYGSYMVTFRNCRFWEETGYRGTGVRVEESILCTTFDNCFFSRSVANRPHLELSKCDTVTINNCAFERSEQYVAPVDPANGRTEEQVKAESYAANDAMKAPLISLDACHAVTIMNCHAEWVFEAFVGIYGNTSGVYIDGVRLAHYAITDYNPNKGYTVVVDPASTASRDIIISRRSYRTQSNNEHATIGPDYVDPVGCVVVEDYYDYTPYQNANYLHERRSVPRIGMTGANLLRNPSQLAFTKTGQPEYLELVEGEWQFAQLDYKSGVNLRQSGAAGPKYRLRMRTVESLDKYDFYTFVIVGRNRSGVSGQIWIDLSGDGNDFTVILPSGDEQFTQTFKFRARATDIVDVVTYDSLNVDVYAMYLVPGIVSDVPYGSEVQSVSALTAANLRTIGIRLESIPVLPAAGWDTRGMIVRQDGNNTDDKLLICKRKADGSFAWVEISTL